MDIIITKNDSIEYVPKHIYGNANYNVSIRCKVKGSSEYSSDEDMIYLWHARYSDMWSGKIFYQFYTRARVPERPPNVIGFSFREKEQIVIFWQELQLIEHNGPSLWYNVTSDSRLVESVETNVSFAVLNA